MDDLDLRDTRGRLIRLAIAIVAGVCLTVICMRCIGSISPAPNKDPVGGSSVGLLAIAMFVVSTGLAHSALSRLR